MNYMVPPFKIRLCAPTPNVHKRPMDNSYLMTRKESNFTKEERQHKVLTALCSYF